MAIKVLNLRTIVPGQQPEALTAGELCFNIPDKVMFVGDGSDFQTDYNGNSVPGIPGQGWFSIPLSAQGASGSLLVSPVVYGQNPNNGDTLVWNSALGHLQWTAGGGGGGGGILSVTGTSPITVDNTDPLNPVISVGLGSTTEVGVVQLEDSIGSSSLTTAATANSVRVAYEEGALALTTAAGAELAAAAAQSTADQALADAATAQASADGAQGTANQALADAAAAQSTADQALADAAAAQATANTALDLGDNAMPRSGGTFNGNVTFAPGTIVEFEGTNVSLSNVYFLETPILPPGVPLGASEAVTYDGSVSGLSATNVQDAITEITTEYVPNASFGNSGDLLVGTGAGTYTALTAGAADYILASDGAGNLSWVDKAAGNVASILAISPVGVDPTDPANPIISILDASTTQAGAVQLNDTTTSNSVTQALTANQGRLLQQQIDALVISNNLTLAGTFDASTGNMVVVTNEGDLAGFVAGDPVPAASAGNSELFIIATVGSASYTPPGGSPTVVHVGDWFLSDGTNWLFLDVGFQAPYATEVDPGLVQLATDAEVQAGVNTDHAVTPAGLQSKVSDSITTTSSTTLASSTAVKAAANAAGSAQATADQAILDAAAAQATADQAILDAAAAQATANQGVSDAAAAQLTADEAIIDSANAQSDANQALLDAAAAQATADQAVLDAADAQSTADQAVLDAAAAQVTANQAVLDAAAAQATADAALPLAGGSMTGTITFAATQPTATTSNPNIVLLEDSTSSTSVSTAATPNSVKSAYDLASAALPKSGGSMTGTIVFESAQTFPVSGIQGASTTQVGVVQLEDSVASTSITFAATSNSVKTAYDAAVAAQATADAALPKSGGTMTGDIVFNAGQVFPIDGIADATTTTRGLVQIGTNIDVAAGIISVADASTSVKGVVQLTNALNSNSQTLGLTAAAGFQLQQQIDTLSVTSNLTFCGTIDASTGIVISNTDAGAIHGILAGSPLPSPSVNTLDHFVVVAVPGTFTPPGGSTPLAFNQGDWVIGTEPTPLAYEWSLQPVGYDAPSATTTREGVVFLATNAEVQAGTDTSNRAVNSASLQSKLSDSTSLASSTTIASSAAVKSAYDLAAGAIPKSVFDFAGDLVVATGADVYTRLPVGANGYVLTVDNTESTKMQWKALPTPPGSATSSVEGLVYALTQSAGTPNTSLGFGANGTLTSGTGNVAIGSGSGNVTSGSFNVAIGYGVSVSIPTANKQLAIGPNATDRWLTGDSSMNVKPGAGLRDRLDSLGTSGQVLSSTGTALEWVTPAPDGVESLLAISPIGVDPTNPAIPIISILSASTTQSGAVQLENSVTSTSTTKAATPSSVKTAYDLANAAIPKTAYVNKGDLLVGKTGGEYVLLPVGTAGQVLKVDSSTPSGLAWGAAGGGGSGTVLSVTGTTPVVVNNSDPANPVISVNVGTITSTGVVQLTDSTSSTSTTTAATPNSVRNAYTLAANAMPVSGGTFSGPVYGYDSVPVGPNELVTKFYADAIAGGFDPKTAVAVATTANITATYNNGTSGVGATLTISSTGTLDGYNLVNGDRILVKNQTTASQNGVYVRTSNTVWTRATDSDTAAELTKGSLYFVANGTVNGGSSFAQVTVVGTVGTDAVSYSKTSFSNFHKYSKEWNVDPVAGSDTDGDGSEELPFLTLSKALTAAGSTGECILLHEGTYNDPGTYNITQSNLTIKGNSRGGALMNSAVAIASTSGSVRLLGVSITGGLSITGSADVYINDFTLDTTSITKSGGGALEITNCYSVGNTGLNVTGAGNVYVSTSSLGTVTLGNASATTTLQGMRTVGPITITLGSLTVNGCVVTSSGPGSQSITASAGTTVILRNSQMVTPAGVLNRVGLDGSYSLDDVALNKAASTFGTNLAISSSFDAIDVLGTMTNTSLTTPVASASTQVGVVVESNGQFKTVSGFDAGTY